MPPRRGRLDERTNASRELWIDDTDCGRRFPSKRGAQLGRRRTFDHPNILRPKHRHDLVETMPRCIRRDYREAQLPPLCRVSYLLDADNHKPSVQPDSEQSEQLAGRRSVHGFPLGRRPTATRCVIRPAGAVLGAAFFATFLSQLV